VKEKLTGGFEYLFEFIRDGVVIDSEVVHNLLPIEGIDHILGVTFKSVAPVATWYIGLFEGNYTPTSTDVAATFPALATECTTYDEATRREWVEGTITTGAVNNSASRAEFTSNANKTIYGGFVASASAKSSTGGVLMSVVRFSSPKQFDVGTVLRVSAGFTLTSV
jgi:hypothetical protein